MKRTMALLISLACMTAAFASCSNSASESSSSSEAATTAAATEETTTEAETETTTEESTGTFKNKAELAKISNIEAVEESNTENNKASADLVISIKTGSALLYIGITLGSITLVACGAYIIKKKILDKGI